MWQVGNVVKYLEKQTLAPHHTHKPQNLYPQRNWLLLSNLTVQTVAEKPNRKKEDCAKSKQVIKGTI